MRTKRRFILAAVAGSAWLAAALLAKPGVVVTQSGARYEGDVNERGDDVIVAIRGVQTTIPRGEVASLEYSVPFEEEFQARLAKLEANDVAGRIELAKWAMSHEQYVAARDVLELAQAIDPNSRDAVDLQIVVRSQLKLAAQARQPDNETVKPPGDGTAKTIDDPGVAAMARQALSQDDIQAIRRIEWRPDDAAVRVRIDNKAARSYADLKQMRWEEFSRMKSTEQARMILNDPNATAEQKRGVEILNDPPSIAEFRRVIQPVIISGCATSGCHGGINATFKLMNPAGTDELAYTNFYMLNGYTKKLDRQVPAGGIFGGATELRMFDRGNGAKSLLLQYGLPAELAEFDHPKVPNFEPAYQSMNDARARAALGWIDRSLRLNPAEYGIEWTPPGASAAPTTNPATGPG